MCCNVFFIVKRSIMSKKFGIGIDSTINKFKSIKLVSFFFKEKKIFLILRNIDFFIDISFFTVIMPYFYIDKSSTIIHHIINALISRCLVFNNADNFDLIERLNHKILIYRKSQSLNTYNTKFKPI